MKILIDCTTTQNQFRYHGIGNYTKSIVEEMVKGYPDNTFVLILFDGESSIDHILNEKNVVVERIGSLQPSDFKYRYTYVPKIRSIVEKYKDGIYFCPYFWNGYPSRLLPTVLVIHDMILPVYNQYSTKGYLQNLIRKFQYWKELKKIRNCRAVVTNSEYTKKDILKYFPQYKEIYPIPLAVNMEKSNPENIHKYLNEDVLKKGYIIYYGGTLVENKNSLGVIEGYKEFLNLYKGDIKDAPYLVIAGKAFVKENDPKVIEFNKRIEELNIQDKVVYTGFFEDEDKEVLLSNSKCFIHLSLYEGFGIAVLEAMSCGTPVIVNNGTSYPEVVKDGGVLVDGTNSKEVGESIYKVISDTQYAKDLGQKALKVSDQYSWKRNAQETMKVIENSL